MALTGNLKRLLERLKAQYGREGVIHGGWREHEHRLHLKLVELGYIKLSGSTTFNGTLTERAFDET